MQNSVVFFYGRALLKLGDIREIGDCLFVKIPAPPFGERRSFGRAVSKRVIDLVEEVGCLFVDVLLIIAQGRNVTVGDVPIVRANIRESAYIPSEPLDLAK